MNWPAIAVGLAAVAMGVMVLLHDYAIDEGDVPTYDDDPTTAMHFAGFGIAVLGILIMTS